MATEPGSTLAELTYQKLRDSIITGAFQPDTKLRMESLQVMFDLSNSPLREALNRLAGERFVIADNRRGFRVAPISRDDFIDLTDARLVVEQGALQSAIEHGNKDWERDVLAAYDGLLAYEAHLVATSLPRDFDWARKHKAFHMLLLSGGRSQRLITACFEVFDLAERYRYLASSHDLPPRQTGNEHQAILTATLDRDAPLATALLRTHVKKSASRVLDMLHSLEEKALPASGRGRRAALPK